MKNVMPLLVDTPQTANYLIPSLANISRIAFLMAWDFDKSFEFAYPTNTFISSGSDEKEKTSGLFLSIASKSLPLFPSHIPIVSHERFSQ